MYATLLARSLAEVRRRLLWIGGVTGLGWGIVAAAICLLLAVWLDLIFELPPAVRIGALLLAILAAIGALTVMLRQAALRGRADNVAQKLDDVAGTGGQIRCGVDLASNPATLTPTSSSLTSGMAEMAIARALDLAKSVPRERAVSWIPVRRSFGTAAAIAALIVLLVLLLPRVAMTQWRRFSDPFGDHPPYSAVQFAVEPAGARVPFGDGLDIHVTVAGAPVEHLELVLESIDDSSREDQHAASKDLYETLPMFPTAGGRWRASLTNITSSASYYVRTQQVRSRRYDLDVITVPKIEDVRFRIVPPAYTRQPPYEGVLPRTGIAGLNGTVVEVSARSNRPLSGGTMLFKNNGNEQLISLKPSSDGSDTAVGAFAIDRSGRIELQVTDADGQSSIETFSAPVTLLSDDRPFVRLLEPQAISLAVPNASLPVVISGEDDYGISNCQLFRSLNDSPYLPVDVPTSSPPSRRLYETLQLPLAEYGLSPGDEIKLFARVVDNDPAAGAGKGSESTIAIVRIIAQEEFERMQRARDGLTMLMAKYQEAQRRMESLADEVAQLEKQISEQPADSPVNQELETKLQELTKRIESEAEALRKLSERSLPYELDKELSPKLNELADELQRLVKQENGLNGKKSNKEAAEALKKMLEGLKQKRKGLDNEVMQPVELIAAVLPLMQDQARYVELYRQQRDLADRLASVKDKNGGDDPAMKARMRDFEEAQSRIRKELGELLSDIENHAAQLPDDKRLDQLRKTATEFAAAVAASGATEAMDNAKDALGEFAGTQAHEEAKRAADILEKFISKCQGMGGEAGQCLPAFNPSLGQCLSTTCQQLLADMGMNSGTGQGSGIGSGSGYSTQRSTLENVGLYGNIPLASSASAGAASGSDRTAAGSREQGAAARNNQGSAFNMPNSASRSSAVDSSVPPAYRQRVGRYFQRIADEVGDQP